VILRYFIIFLLICGLLLAAPIDAKRPSRKKAAPPPTAVVAPLPLIKTITLPALSLVTLTMERSLATDKREKKKGEKRNRATELYANTGDTFFMSVTTDVSIDNTVIIPKGTRGVGEVLAATGRKGFGKSGKIEIQLQYIEMNGKQHLMEGVHFQKGKSNSGALTTGIILAGPLAGFFIKGEEAEISAGTTLNFRTKNDISIDVIVNP
jgi:hypothetical protein